MLTVALWKWQGWRPSEYTAWNVNATARQIRANLSLEHRIVCFTDDPAGITECDTFPLWDPPQVPGQRSRAPACWVRLEMFSQWFAEAFGPRVLSFDLDSVVLGRLDPLITGEDLRICRGQSCPYNGSMILHTCGTRTELARFDPEVHMPQLDRMRRANGRRVIGSDQRWIAWRCPGEALFTPEDGVAVGETQINGLARKAAIPRVAFMPGTRSPWNSNGRARFPDLHRIYMRYASPTS